MQSGIVHGCFSIEHYKTAATSSKHSLVCFEDYFELCSCFEDDKGTGGSRL